MKTWQDLEKAGNKGAFCETAIQQFMSTEEYQTARKAELYYRKHNPEIENFQKFIYTLSGQRRPDIYSANYKLKSNWFRNLVIQQVSYVLGNGVTFQDMDTKERLGKAFDYKIQKVAKKAMVHGRAFGFWNNDHLEVFGYADTDGEAGFCPLYSEDTAELMAGIRFWSRKVGNEYVRRYTLYEPDGMTEYIKSGREDIKEHQPKRAYKTVIGISPEGGLDYCREENYTALPIIQMYANDTKESELVGVKEKIDCYDLLQSGLMNVIDDTAEIYWILKNTGGMQDADLAQFIQRIKTVHSAVVDGDADAGAEAHTVSIPTEARELALEMLRKDIYEDFGSLDVKSLSASQKTTQEIQAAYQMMDNKCADFQYQIEEFIGRLLELVGIDDSPSFTWNKIINQQEQTNMVLMAAQYLTPEIILSKLPFLTPEEVEMISDENDQESYDQFNGEEEGFDSEQATAEIDSILENLMKEIEDL